MLWLRHLWDGVASLLAMTASLVAALAIAKAFIDWWRRGPGRRRRWSSLFARVALQVRVDYVIALFGEPAYRQRREGSRFKAGADPDGAAQEAAIFTEHVWLLDSDGYLQILTDESDNVVRYSLTTRSRKFNPRLPVGAVEGSTPKFYIQLGRTLFSEIPIEPDRVYRGPYGATVPYEYRQSYYYGRPGGYADWTCSYNAVGLTPVIPLPYSVPVPPWENALSARGWLATLDDEQRSMLEVSKAGTIINTVTIDHHQSDRSGNIRYGPDRELVRLMPAPSAQWQKSVAMVKRICKPATSFRHDRERPQRDHVIP